MQRDYPQRDASSRSHSIRGMIAAVRDEVEHNRRSKRRDNRWAKMHAHAHTTQTSLISARQGWRGEVQAPMLDPRGNRWLGHEGDLKRATLPTWGCAENTLLRIRSRHWKPRHASMQHLSVFGLRDRTSALHLHASKACVTHISHTWLCLILHTLTDMSPAISTDFEFPRFTTWES